MRKKINITIQDKEKSLLYHLRRAGYFLPADCGGKGNCGKCKVRFLRDAPEPREGDREALTGHEIQEGYRLACLTKVEGETILEINDYEKDKVQEPVSRKGDIMIPGDLSSCALAIDLGTTTIAASLVDTEAGKTIKTLTTMNSQWIYGADVISRIEAANRGEGKTLQKLVFDDLNLLCVGLDLGDTVTELKIPVILSGNTTMEHLLQGLPCDTLGVYPFRPADISLHRYKNLTILPGISTYVGADIASGIVSCGMDRDDKISILIDLGTNGEMAIGSRQGILVSSTAAGPAFEGGNISHGMAGTPGAIDRVEIKDGELYISSIGDRKPVGICGSGVIETVYELRKEEIVDETGLMEDRYFKDGFPLSEEVVFTAKDVREVQLAKSAIRAGVEILMHCYGVNCDQVDRVYLAGGFGQKIDCHKAVGIGMLPQELESKIRAVGNSSLTGAVLFSVDPAIKDRFLKVTEMAKEINLANHEMFQDLFVEHMFFSEINNRVLSGQVSNTVDWNCPSIETVPAGDLPDQTWFRRLTDPEEVGKIMEERARMTGRDYWTLPPWQNLEAVVYGNRIQNDGSYFLPSSYCVKSLDQLQDLDFDLLSDPMMRAMVHSIADHKDKPMMLEVEAPFSILGALMNPADLYLCMEDREQEVLLSRILHQIADASAEFIRACLEAGCRVISLADPAGTMDLVGEKCYKKFCGESVIYLMKRCQPYLGKGILHLCRKISLSLVLTNRVEVYPYHFKENRENFMDILREMADDPEVLYTGMTCIHNQAPDLKDSHIIKIK